MDGNGEVKVIPLNPDKPHPDLELDDNGLWTFKQKPRTTGISPEHTAKIVKFHAMTRQCPWHGEVEVVTRNFQPERMHSIEGLSCGHTLLITRQVKGLRTPHAPDEPKNWRHHGWLLSFRDTVKATQGGE